MMIADDTMWPKRKATQEQFVYKKLSLKPSVSKRRKVVKKSKKLHVVDVLRDDLDASQIMHEDREPICYRGNTLSLTLMEPTTKKQPALSQRCDYSSLDTEGAEDASTRINSSSARYMSANSA